MPQPPLCQSRRAQNVRLWNKSFAEGDGGNAPEWGLFIFLWGIPFWRGIRPGALRRVRRGRADVRLSDARTPNLAPRAVWGAHAGTVLPGIGGTLRRGGGAPQGMSVPAATFPRRRHPHPRGRLEAPSVTANGVAIAYAWIVLSDVPPVRGKWGGLCLWMYGALHPSVVSAFLPEEDRRKGRGRGRT